MTVTYELVIPSWGRIFANVYIYNTGISKDVMEGGNFCIGMSGEWEIIRWNVLKAENATDVKSFPLTPSNLPITPAIIPISCRPLDIMRLDAASIPPSMFKHQWGFIRHLKSLPGCVIFSSMDYAQLILVTWGKTAILFPCSDVQLKCQWFRGVKRFKTCLYRGLFDSGLFHCRTWYAWAVLWFEVGNIYSYSLFDTGLFPVQNVVCFGSALIGGR